MPLKHLHVSTAFYHAPVFSRYTVPFTHLQVHCVLIQQASLFCTMEHPFCSLVPLQRMQKHETQIHCTHRSEAFATGQSKPLCLVLWTTCSWHSEWCFWDQLRSPPFPRYQDAIGPDFLGTPGLTPVLPSLSKWSLKGQCFVSIRKCV